MPAPDESIFEALSPLACKLYRLMQDLAQGFRVIASLDALAARAGVTARSVQGALAELRHAHLVHRLPKLPRTPSCDIVTSPAVRRAAPDRKYTSGLKSPRQPSSSHGNAHKPLSIHNGSLSSSTSDRKPASGQERPPFLTLATLAGLSALDFLPSDPHRLMLLLDALPPDQAKAIADALPQSARDALIAHASNILNQTSPS